MKTLATRMTREKRKGRRWRRWWRGRRGEELVKVELAKEQQAEAADGAGEGVPPRGLG